MNSVRHLLPVFWIMSWHVGCDSNTEKYSSLREAMAAQDNPDSIPGLDAPTERNINNLPTTGQVERAMWSGDWWPIRRGGMLASTHGESSSPIGKYDAAMALHGQAIAWEKDFNRKFGTVHWAGFCDGLAAASMMTQEPHQAVKLGNITFQPGDIKALLVRMWSTSGSTVGGRCDNRHASLDRQGRETQRACRDINPGTLHLALANFVGRAHLAVILDQSPYVEVWNFPVTGFSASLRPVSVTEATALILPGADGYPWNSTAAKFFAVTTKVFYKTLTAGQVSVGYQYVLETDQDGTVLGGEWIGTSKSFHPDFVWRPGGPRLQEDATFNPYLKRDVIEDLYHRSL